MLDQPAPKPSASPITSRERSQIRAPRDAGDQAVLSGTALLAILRRRKLPLLAAMVVLPLLAYVALSRMTPLYTANGTLLYDSSEYKARELQSIMRVDPITDAVMATQAEVLRGMPVVEKVADQLNLHTNPEFNTTLKPASWTQRATAAARRVLSHFVPAFATAPLPEDNLPGPKLDPVRNATLRAVQASLTVAPLKASHVLEVSFSAENPVIAAAAVNAAMDLYVKAQMSAKAGAVYRAREWLKQREKELRAEVRHSEDGIAQYSAQKGLVEGVHARLDTEQISLLTENLVRARNDLAAAEGRLAAASGRTGSAAQAAIAPSVVALRARQSQLSGELQSMLGRLGSGHPDVQSTRAQLAEVDRGVGAEISRVVAASDSDVRGDRERVASLEQSLREAQAHVERDSQAQIPLNAMQRDADASRGLLQAVLEGMQQTTQQSELESPDAHEVSLALPPPQPSFPRTGPVMAGTGAFSVVFGLLLVYLFELADSSFRSGDDIRTVLGLRCFALIPRIRRRALGGMNIEDYAARKPLSPFAEQLRALRTGLSMWPERPRIVAITAARPQEGKTTVTRALGRLAAMNGERVIVLDCDIRQTTLSRAKLNRSSLADTPLGLVDYLQDRVQLADVITRDDASGMYCIPCGSSEANALNLLMSATMARLLQTLRDEYDLVLLDGPPVLAVTDARVIAGLADATLLCVRWRDTPRDKVLHALELLEEAHANVVGAALTQVDVNVHVRSGYADAEVYHPRYGGYFRE